jgi:hypothetical protein
MTQQVQVAKQAKQKNTRVARGLIWVAGVLNIALLLMLCAYAQNGAAVPIVLIALAVNVVVGWYAISQGLMFELMVERTWKKVCSGLGGNFVGQGRARLQPGISYDFYGSFKKAKVVRDKIYPKLRDVRGDWNSFTGVIYPLYGQSLSDYTTQADRFELAFGLPVSFDIGEHGLIRIRAGRIQVLSEYGFQEL